MTKLNKHKSTKRSCNSQDIIFDLKIIMPDYYLAQFIESGNKLKLQFDNGQKFIIKVKECNRL